MNGLLKPMNPFDFSLAALLARTFELHPKGPETSKNSMTIATIMIFMNMMRMIFMNAELCGT